MSFFARTSLAFLFLMWGCPPAPLTPQPDADSAVPSPDPFDAAPAPPPRPKPLADALPPTTQCGRACAQLAFIGCPEGFPTPGGETCEGVCLKVGAFPGMKLDMACAIGAYSIADARKCRGILCGGK